MRWVSCFIPTLLPYAVQLFYRKSLRERINCTIFVIDFDKQLTNHYSLPKFTKMENFAQRKNKKVFRFILSWKLKSLQSQSATALKTTSL